MMSNRRTGSKLPLAAAFLFILTAISASAQQCNSKTAGYFKQMPAFSRAGPSPIALAGIIRSLTGAIGNPARGRQIMADEAQGNCLACHPVPALGDRPAHGNLGPSLAGVGGRYTEPQLRQILVDPGVLFPETVMPAYHKPPTFDRIPQALAGKTILSASEVEDIVAFLKNLK